MLSALAAQVNTTEILIAIRIVKSSTQYQLCMTCHCQQRKREPHMAWNPSGKTYCGPLSKWEKWQIQAKLALLAKENIALDTLLAPKPENVQLPLEPIYESTVTGSSDQSERKRLARHAQLKMNWKNRCQKQMETGIMCGDKLWTKAYCKTVSMLYLSLGTEGRRIICSRNPHLKMDILATVEL